MKESIALKVVALNDVKDNSELGRWMYTKGKTYSASIDRNGSCELVNDKGNRHWVYLGFLIENFEGR